MKLTILNVLLLLFMTEYASAQSIEELNSRRIKEHKQSSYTSTSTGRHKKSVDWDVDDDTWGLAYTFSPHFPLSFSANGTWSYFQLGGELGFTLSGKRYDWDTNVTDQPIGYIMAQPGFFCKYFSVQCGVGALFDIRRKNIEENGGTTVISTTINGQSDISISQSTYYVDQTTCGVNLCIKPTITGFIPISDDDYYLTISAGYLFVPKINELNGFTIGVGIQCEL